MSRPQPYRIDWTVEPQSLPEASQRLGTQFESIDQMFQTLFEDLNAAVASGATGVLPVSRGGTNATGVTLGGVAYGISGAVTGPAYAFTAAGTSQTLLISNGTGAPTFGAADLSGAGIGGILPLARGGTNASGAAVTGGVIYSDATKWLATAAGTAGQVLLSSGTSAPVFGFVGLVTGITGILPLVNGGTNASGVAVTGGVIYSDTTKWLASAAGTAGHFLMSSGTAAPKFIQIDLSTTGVTGVLPTARGGTNTGAWTTGSVIFVGTGGTVLAENNANFQWDNSTASLGLGTAPATTFHVSRTSTGGLIPLFDQWSNGTGAPNIAFTTRAGRGTSGAPLQTLTDQFLLAFSCRGASTGGFGPDVASFQFGPAEDFTTGAMGTYFRLFTTAIGTTGPMVEQMRVTSAGKVGIGVTVPTAALHLKAGISGASGAPMKLTAGTLLATPELGAIEFTDDGTTAHFYVTTRVATVVTRVQVA